MLSLCHDFVPFQSPKVVGLKGTSCCRFPHFCTGCSTFTLSLYHTSIEKSLPLFLEFSRFFALGLRAGRGTGTVFVIVRFGPTHLFKGLFIRPGLAEAKGQLLFSGYSSLVFFLGNILTRFCYLYSRESCGFGFERDESSSVR